MTKRILKNTITESFFILNLTDNLEH
jgi:hypothetical protein